MARPPINRDLDDGRRQAVGMSTPVIQMDDRYLDAIEALRDSPHPEVADVLLERYIASLIPGRPGMTDSADWMGAGGPAGVAMDLLQRVYVAKANEKDLAVIADEILSLTGDDRTAMREGMAWLAGLPGLPEVNRLGKSGLDFLRTCQGYWYAKPGYYPARMLKLRLCDARNELQRKNRKDKG